MRIAYLLPFLLFPFLSNAQIPGKRPLTHDDYDGWKTVQSTHISRDGKWVLYEINPQEGDGTLVIEAPATNRKLTLNRGYAATFSADGAYVVAKIKPPLEAVRAAKKKKLKAEQMPKDSLVVIQLENNTRKYFAQVKSFGLPKEKGDWLAILTDAKASTPAAKDSTRTTPKVPKGKKQPKGDRLTLLNLKEGTSVTISYVNNYKMADEGTLVLLSREALHDSSEVRGVFAFETSSQKTMQLDTSSRIQQYLNLGLDKKGEQAVWMASADSTKAEVKKFALYYRKIKDKDNRLVADTTTTALYPQGWSVSEYRTPRFSDDGRRLYFGTSPLAALSLKDTTRLDDELPRLDVWSWTDRKLQPMQDKQKKNERERNYLALYDIATQKKVLLGGEEVPYVSPNYKANHAQLLGTNDQDYQRMSSWELGHSDFYLINATTGAKTPIARDVVGRAEMSPGGKYVTWFDERDTAWRAYDIKGTRIVELTKGLPVAFHNEEHDTPDYANAYGSAGWTADDRYFWVYDRYDIWQLDPTGKEKPLVVTQGYGRQEKVALRYVELDEEDPFIHPEKELLLTGHWERDKESGLLRLTGAARGKVPVVLVKEAAYYSARALSKAEKAEAYIFQKGNYTQANELYYSTDQAWKTPQKLTNLSAQMDSIRWGNVELVSWMNAQGVRLEGLLFKPEGFDPTQKYPMLVYYYERNAETLHLPRTPAPSRSTINIPYCVSNGYLVFVPDIVYGGGTPGKNAYDCIVTGVLDLVRKGYVDQARIGIQGQSWGGYQTAYLITQTNLFRAAMAGAIVSNMTSAYGGIRWGTGMSRMFQYEKTQSRIGGTLWEKPMYYLENSPLFYADRVQTPLLMMHNDADGSVPWYQGIEFFTALRRLNKPAWMLVYNDEDHNLTKRPNMKDLSVRMYQFFDHYLKDAPLPSWMSQGRSVLDKDRWDMKYD
ncbi:prolyl oligopeptidase family serine peptidase [Rhabdobacter roseus]|uniref:Dipeptidyl aminopeptidase/acylaminoacyl peptidase n=1 Tax=Rhabdobacter roseus TaxID=1655419 RepID=A0A840TTZ7_9BACT|nr:prolyl oligopeptidase family serine peptidase [Rhabdobacter roseus]MBB5283518.1 dipeptidyl aminopeptidase/acylaminoacyl peptidase [Rhabdobacter roseus]